MEDNEGIISLFNQLCTKYVGNKQFNNGNRFKKYFHYFLKHYQEINEYTPSQVFLIQVYLIRNTNNFNKAQQLTFKFNKLKNDGQIDHSNQMILKFLTLLSNVSKTESTDLSQFPFINFTKPMIYTLFPSETFSKPFLLFPQENAPCYQLENQICDKIDKTHWCFKHIDPYQPRKFSWEDIGTNNLFEKKHFLSQAGPKAIDMLFISHIQRLSLISESALTLPTPCLMDQIFQDIPKLLTGIQSPTFILIDEREFILNPNIYIPGLTSNFLREFLEVGSNYLTLQKFVHSSHTSLTMLCFQKGVKDFLEFYDQFVFKFMPEIKSLIQIKQKLNKIIYQLSYVAQLCGCMSQSSLPQGIELLDYLYERCKQGNMHILILASFLRAASVPYLKFLQRWLFEGIIDDPFNEFPIFSECLQPGDEFYWSRSFKERSSFPFFSHVYEQLLICGKSFCLLKLCFPKYYRLLFVNYSYPLLELQFSKELVSLIKQSSDSYAYDRTNKLKQELEFNKEQLKRIKVPSTKKMLVKKDSEEEKQNRLKLIEKNQKYLQDLKNQIEENLYKKAKKEEPITKDAVDPKLVEEALDEILAEYKNRLDNEDLSRFREEWMCKLSLKTDTTNNEMDALTPVQPENVISSENNDLVTVIKDENSNDEVDRSLVSNLNQIDSLAIKPIENIRKVIESGSNEASETKLKEQDSLAIIENINKAIESNSNKESETKLKEKDLILDINNIHTLNELSQAGEEFNDDNNGIKIQPVEPYFNDYTKIITAELTLKSLEDVFKKDEKDELLMVPFQHLIDRSLNPLLKAQFHLVNKSLITLFFEELKIQSHLGALKNAFFFQDAEFSDCLSKELLNAISKSCKVSDVINPFILNNILDEALLGSFIEYHDNFSFYVEESPKNLSDILSSLQLRYKLVWPCNLVVPESSMMEYNRVFSFFMKIKHSMWSLKEIWLLLKGSKYSNPSQFKMVELYRYRMHHFLWVLQDYMLGQAISLAWKEFNHKITNCLDNLEDFQQAHVAYIQTVLTNCLLTHDYQTVMKIILTILKGIVEFKNYLKFRDWYFNENTQCYEHPNFDKLRMKFSEFEQYTSVLFKILSKLNNSHFLVVYLDMNYFHTNYSRLK